MTSEQKAWLDSNPEFSAIGRAGGNVRWVSRGTLMPDGTFVAATRMKPIPEFGTSNGAFGVGKIFIYEPGQPMKEMGKPVDAAALTTTPNPLRRAQKVIEATDDEVPVDPRGYVTNWQQGGGGGKKQS